jgi:hypothetical protein
LTVAEYLYQIFCLLSYKISMKKYVSKINWLLTYFLFPFLFKSFYFSVF